MVRNISFWKGGVLIAWLLDTKSFVRTRIYFIFIRVCLVARDLPGAQGGAFGRGVFFITKLIKLRLKLGISWKPQPSQFGAIAIQWFTGHRSI